jgi:hypothetical protein
MVSLKRIRLHQMERLPSMIGRINFLPKSVLNGCVIASIGMFLSHAAAQEKAFELVEGFQRVPDEFFTGDLSWLLKWQYCHLRRIPSSAKIKLLIVKTSTGGDGTAIGWVTYAIIEISDEEGEDIIRIADTDLGTIVKQVSISKETRDSLLKTAWSWIEFAGIRSQEINLGTDNNVVAYVIGGKPLKNGAVGRLQMVQAINAQPSGKLDKMLANLDSLLEK